MAISVKHSFSSAKADGPDTTLVQPSNWNAEHQITLASGKVLGRDTSSAGVVMELPIAVDPAGNVALSATGYFTPAVGTTAQRPVAPVVGQFRFNSSLGKYEGFLGTAWGSVGGGATGGGADSVFIENDQSVNTNYTIPATKNAMSTGPITIAAGITVTVSSGARYVVI